MYQLNKEKYLRMAEAEGYPAAITALHHEMEVLEQETFEGRRGWQPEGWNDLEQFREFSRELWELHLQKGASPDRPKPKGFR